MQSKTVMDTNYTFALTDEASIGMLHAKERNVGKSLTLKTIAKGQGHPEVKHPILLSSGNQILSGTSL